MYNVEFIIPSSLENTIKILNDDSTVLPIAGGTDLLVQFHKDETIEKLKSTPYYISPDKKLININDLVELKGIRQNKNYIEIGSCTTHTEIINNEIIKKRFPSLLKACSLIGSPQIRNRGTIGGNIMNASPAADSVLPLAALKAELISLSKSGKCNIAINDFFKAPGKTKLKRDELLTCVRIPVVSSDSIQFYSRIANRKAHACAKVNLSFYAEINDNFLHNVSIALGAVGPTIIMAQLTADYLNGKIISNKIITRACEILISEISPIDDIRSTKEYRKAMIGELLKQGLSKIII